MKKIIIALALLISFDGYASDFCYDTLTRDGEQFKAGKKIVSGNSYQRINGEKRINGRLESGYKKNRWVMWYPNGNKESEGSYTGYGDEDGEWSYWYENGNKKIEGKYENGNREGKWISWYENGKKESEGDYKKGYEYGHWVYWYENGKKQMEGDWTFDKELNTIKKEKKWVYYYENGKKSKEEVYDEKTGKVVTKEWDKKGKEIEEE